jgi:isocitrate dehydrogenase
MSSIKVYIDDQVAQAFRRTAMQVFGYGKGSLSKAAEEAFRKWVQEYAAQIQNVTIPSNPIEAIANQLQNVSSSSVDLQHKAKELRAFQAID